MIHVCIDVTLGFALYVIQQCMMSFFREESLMCETFVKVPGIIEIRWTSDDPEFFHPSADLFDQQARGIPEW